MHVQFWVIKTHKRKCIGQVQVVIAISCSALLPLYRFSSNLTHKDPKMPQIRIRDMSNGCGGGRKILHLVRHAQGTHNVAMERNHDELMSYDYFDAHLSPLGLSQVDELRNQVHECGLLNRVELVITSPLTRTMQTAVGVFGGEEHVDDSNAPPLMVANVGESQKSAVSSVNCPPFLAVELCRERLGVHPCDKRRSIKEYQSLFPAIDFSIVDSEDDILWKADVRENNEELAARGRKFINWLWTREEKEIAVVSHSAFLLQTLNSLRDDCAPSARSRLCKMFKNCELVSIVILDKSSMVDSDSFAIDLLK